MRRKAFEDLGFWFKMPYDVKEQNGRMMITSVGREEPSFYNPLNYSSLYNRPATSIEHNTAAPYTALAKLDLEDMEEIKGFVNTWGLLGLWEEKKYNKYEVSYSFRSLNKKGRHSYQEPLSIFKRAVEDYQQFVEEIINFNKLTKKNSENISDKTIAMIVSKMEGNEELTAKEFAKKYGFVTEDVEAIIEEDTKGFLLSLKEKEALVGLDKVDYWDVSKRTHISTWNTRSLLAAIYKATLDEYRKGKIFLHCDWMRCKVKFITDNPKNQYCSDRCRQNYHTYNSNVRKWKGKLRSEFPEKNGSWLDEQVDLYSPQSGMGYTKIKKMIERKLK